MTITLRKVLAVLWTVVPPLVLSALVHSTDSDVGGLAGLLRPTVLFSVLVYGAPLAGLALSLLWLRVQGNRGLSTAVLLLCSALLGLVLVVLGSTAQSPAQLAWSFCGATAVVSAFFALAFLPSSRLWPVEGSAVDS